MDEFEKLQKYGQNQDSLFGPKGTKIVGVLILIHFFASAAVLYLRNVYIIGSYALAIVPMFMLSMEMAANALIQMTIRVCQKQSHIPTLQIIALCYLFGTAIYVLVQQCYYENFVFWQFGIILLAIEIAVGIKLVMMGKQIWRLAVLGLVMIQTANIVANVDLDLKIDWRLILIPAYTALSICAVKVSHQMTHRKLDPIEHLNDSAMCNDFLLLCFYLLAILEVFLLAIMLNGNYSVVSTTLIISCILFAYCAARCEDLGKFALNLIML